MAKKETAPKNLGNSKIGSTGKAESASKVSALDKSSGAAKTEDNGKMAITSKGLRLLLVGLIVMVSGYILMIGGGSDDPEVFNYAMFDFQRLVAAPIVIILGIVIEIIAIMGAVKGRKGAKDGGDGK